MAQRPDKKNADGKWAKVEAAKVRRASFARVAFFAVCRAPVGSGNCVRRDATLP